MSVLNVHLKKSKITRKMAVWSKTGRKLAGPKLDCVPAASLQALPRYASYDACLYCKYETYSTEGPSSWICLQTFCMNSTPSPLPFGDGGYSSVLLVMDWCEDLSRVSLERSVSELVN